MYIYIYKLLYRDLYTYIFKFIFKLFRKLMMRLKLEKMRTTMASIQWKEKFASFCVISICIQNGTRPDFLWIILTVFFIITATTYWMPNVDYTPHITFPLILTLPVQVGIRLCGERICKGNMGSSHGGIWRLASPRNAHALPNVSIHPVCSHSPCLLPQPQP